MTNCGVHPMVWVLKGARGSRSSDRSSYRVIEKTNLTMQEKEKKNKKLRGCLRMSKKISNFAAENELSCPCGKEILDL